jgi:hypothetical protein
MSTGASLRSEPLDMEIEPNSRLRRRNRVGHCNRLKA